MVALATQPRGLGCDPVQHDQRRDDKWVDAVQRVADRMGVPVDRDEHLDAEDRRERDEHEAGDGDGAVRPAPRGKPGAHGSLLDAWRVLCIAKYATGSCHQPTRPGRVGYIALADARWTPHRRLRLRSPSRADRA